MAIERKAVNLPTEHDDLSTIRHTLGEEKIKGMLYQTKVTLDDGSGEAVMIIDYEQIIIQLNVEDRVQIFGCKLATNLCFVNKIPATPKQIAFFQKLSTQIEKLVEAGTASVEEIKEDDE
ncbi:hypothetical protein EBR96_06070 [bacterium]|nr:hypothetical protein [bacterium]